MKARELIIALVMICTAATAEAKIKEATYSKSAITAQRHEVVDIKFKSSQKVSAPFEVEFTATFTSPSGATQIVPAFFNGGSEWVVRFSSGEAGEWRYTTTSELKPLSGKSGKVVIDKTAYQNRKGAIQPDSKSPEHLVWSDGAEPYFLLGFECDFLFALDYHNPSTKRLDSFLDRVAECGFNHIVMNVYANDVVWKKDPKLIKEYEVGGDETIFPFLGSNSKPDHSALNIEFFKRFDRTMEALNDRNLISHLMIYVWNKNVAWAKPSSAEDNRYFDYVAKRYQAFPNVVWDISKEALLYGVIDDNYVSERIERLRKLDSYDRMVTVHDIGYCNRNSDKVDMSSSQNWKLLVNHEMQNSRQRNKNKPLLNVEHGGYEECDYEVFCGNYINAEYCLRRNYESVFAGTYTTYYWQGCSWNVLIDDFDTSTKVTYRPKMEYFKYMSELFTKYPYHTFKADPKNSNSGFCMTNGEGTYLFYMPKESYKTSTGQIMKLAKKVSFQWFNTHTGEYTDVNECTQMNIFANEPHPWHMKSDAVLIMKIIEAKKEAKK